MKSLIFPCLSASLMGGAACLLVLFVTAALRRFHAPARLLCALWGVALLRFVLPGGIPFNVPRPHSPQLSQAAEAVQQIAAAPAPAAAVPHTVTAAAPAAAPLTIWHLAAAVWLAGIVFLLLRAVLSYAKLHRQVALACKTPDRCYTCAGVDVPFTLGILRPRIYMPQSVQGSARAAILYHEQTHIARRDTLTKPLGYFITCLHWWNPLAWLAFAQFERTMEAACDEAVTRSADAAQRTAYCESILQFTQRRVIPGSLAFGQGRVKDRICHVLRYRRPGRAVLAVCVAVSLFAGTACMAKPVVTVTPEEPSTSTQTTAEAAAQPTATPVPEAAAAQPTATPEPEQAAAAFDPSSLLCPLDGSYTLNRCFGNGHKGDDLVAEKGTPVYAAAAGLVTTSVYETGYGNYVVLDHGADADGKQWETLYAHMDSLTVAEGQYVAQGEQIGTVGTTGNSTGDHLHLEVHCDGALLAPSDCMTYAATATPAPELEAA